MAKNGFIESDGGLELWVNGTVIATLTENGLFMAGGKTLASKTLRGSGGEDVAIAAKQSNIADTTSGTNVDTNARATQNSIIDALEAWGILATS